jgi:hypothetical protein
VKCPLSSRSAFESRSGRTSQSQLRQPLVLVWAHPHDAVRRRRARCVPVVRLDRPSCFAGRLLSSSVLAYCRSVPPCRYTVVARVVECPPVPSALVSWHPHPLRACSRCAAGRGSPCRRSAAAGQVPRTGAGDWRAQAAPSRTGEDEAIVTVLAGESDEQRQDAVALAGGGQCVGPGPR